MRIVSNERPIITFVIPVRHPENARDWPALKTRLQQTARSIAAQNAPCWRGVVVANRGSDMPGLPDGFEVVLVDLPPNPEYELIEANREAASEAVRKDKGRRILAGMLHGTRPHFFMVVDDDDFVSRRIAGFVREHADADGWTLRKGYLWTEGGAHLYEHDDFSGICGSSHIVRADHFRLPTSVEAADEEFVRSMLGSHIKIEGILRDRGVELRELPFRGAIYRVGYNGQHSKSRSVFRNFVLNRKIIEAPFEWFRQLTRLRRISRALSEEFGVAAAGSGVSR
ncbi:hypothetical protein [Aureimonas sp. AU4]|uniref:hypothetical protein n=1 Tax=Aureimonas sp. AU4 TaxID=1638163 RepID=UPI0007838C32|nr:hypothetical protein [Aureimonas sp. AU4]